MKKIIILGMLMLTGIAYSQTVTIDYYTWNPSNPPCRIFAGVSNVPATGAPSGLIQHITSAGQPYYSTSDRSVQIQTTYDPAGAGTWKGGSFRIYYNFKAGYSYSIYVTAAAVENTVGFQTGPYFKLVIDNSAGGLSSNAPCNGPEQGTQDLTGNPPAEKLFDNVMKEFQYNLTNLGSQSTLNIIAIPAQNGGTKTVRISKIKIEEIPPPVSFTIPSTTSVPCGIVAAQTFTVTNVNGTTGITNYTWNLGSVPNNWLYNGVAAPATVSTGIANSINLTPACGTVPKNISATVTANLTAYSTNISTVSITPPAMSIDNNAPICTSQNYPITGFPSCNATVVWSASPTGIVTPNTSTSATPTFTKFTSGNITLTATVTACGTVQPALTKTIRVGTFTSADYPITGPSSTTCGTHVIYSVPQLSNSPTYVWMYQGSPWQYEGGQGTRFLQMRAPTSTSGGVFTVHVDNACGIGPFTSKITSVSCSFALIDLFQVLPNPATNEVTVTANSISTTSFTELNIYNQHGVLKKTQKFAKVKKGTINVSSLPTGIYFIEIVDGVNRVRKQLSIVK